MDEVVGGLNKFVFLSEIMFFYMMLNVRHFSTETTFENETADELLRHNISCKFFGTSSYNIKFHNF